MFNHFNISDFSPHLFWDINKDELDFDLHRAQIIHRVVEYGLMSDWLLLQKIYNPDIIKETIVNLRDLDKVTLNYLSLYYNIEKKNLDVTHKVSRAKASGTHELFDGAGAFQRLSVGRWHSFSFANRTSLVSRY